MFQRRGPKLLDNPTLTSIASKLGKSPAQCLVRWGIQHGTSILPKSVNAERIKSNIDVLDWQLPEDDYHALCNLETQERMISAKFWLNPSGPYKTMEDLWDESSQSKSNYKILKQPVAKLSSGFEIPLVGLGTWKSKPGEIESAVVSAL